MIEVPRRVTDRPSKLSVRRSRALHARFGNDYEAARRELARIIERYFQADLGVVLEEATPVRK